jgi:hypothetical protein
MIYFTLPARYKRIVNNCITRPKNALLMKIISIQIRKKSPVFDTGLISLGVIDAVYVKSTSN